jgi:hypothetical protein
MHFSYRRVPAESPHSCRDSLGGENSPSNAAVRIFEVKYHTMWKSMLSNHSIEEKVFGQIISLKYRGE